MGAIASGWVAVFCSMSPALSLKADGSFSTYAEHGNPTQRYSSTAVCGWRGDVRWRIRAEGIG